MDILNLIKIFSIIILITGCLIATYTDITRGIIPNSLTFTMIIVGISITTYYYVLVGFLNIYYYVSICGTFILSYILWIIGLWAGGDVKLVTAISTLLIPDYLSIIPTFTVMGFRLPVSMSVPPILYLILNSFIVVLPVLLIYVIYVIIKKKPYLIKDIKESINIIDVIINLNIFLLIIYIFRILNIDLVILELGFIIIFSLLFSRKIRENKYLSTATIIITLMLTLLYSNIFLYLIELITLLFIVLFISILRSRILSEALVDYYEPNMLEEGLVLSKSLIKSKDNYKFSSKSYNTKPKGSETIIVDSIISGLTHNDIKLLNMLYNENLIDEIPIKKSIAFGPFIFLGLIVTLLVGNTYSLFIGVL